MINDTNSTVVAVYGNHEVAEAAVRKLADGNIPMNEISIIGKGYHTDEKVVGFYNIGERMKFWGKYGAFWGGMWGILVGGLFVTVPVIGPVVVLGSLAAMVLSGIEGVVVVGGVSALGGALFSLGVPKDTILQYESALKADGFMVLVQGTMQEIERARRILKISNARQIDTHCSKVQVINESYVPQIKVAS